MTWLWVAGSLVVGVLLGIGMMSLCVMSGGIEQRERIALLRVVLGNLERAVEDATPPDESHPHRIAEALDGARKVLNS